MPTVTVTFVQATFVMATFVHIRNISSVTDQIFTKLGRFLGPSSTDANCHGDIYHKTRQKNNNNKKAISK